MISAYSSVDKAPDRCRGAGSPIMMNDKFIVGSVGLDIILLKEDSTLVSCSHVCMLHH